MDQARFVKSNFSWRDTAYVDETQLSKLLIVVSAMVLLKQKAMTS